MSQEYRGNGKSGIVFPDIFSLCIELCGLKTLFSETLVQKYQKTCVRERSCSPFFPPSASPLYAQPSPTPMNTG